MADCLMIPAFAESAIAKCQHALVKIEMPTEPNLENYFSAVVKEGLYPNRGNLQFHLKTVFNDIALENRRVLDIGGGSGLHSFYVACMGAKEVVCLEPETKGSRSGTSEKFRKLGEILGQNHVRFEPATFQAFDPGGKQFDVILLHNSINHLDETACINLLDSEASRVIYLNIFSKLSSLASDGAKLIVCDCSRYNIFALLRVRNPFAPTIEWHKHQMPEVWVDLLSQVGFTNPSIRWTAFNTLRSLGKVLLGNKLLSYFLRSHFHFTMEKP